MGQSLKGKVAIVTGAGKGIGKETALALAKEGVHLGLISRTEADLQAVKEAVESFGVKASYALCDVADLASVERAVATLQEALGKTDILINNAGIAKFGSFLELSPEEWTQMIDVNLIGVYHVTRAVLPQMLEAESGDIINISSTAGERGGPITSAYSASKFGLLGLTESLAMEVRKKNIRVTALTPSTVATDLAYRQNLTDGDPETVLQPEDLAQFIVAQLQLHPRMFIKSAGLWSTNP